MFGMKWFTLEVVVMLYFALGVNSNNGFFISATPFLPTMQLRTRPAYPETLETLRLSNSLLDTLRSPSMERLQRQCALQLFKVYRDTVHRFFFADSLKLPIDLLIEYEALVSIVSFGRFHADAVLSSWRAIFKATSDLIPHWLEFDHKSSVHAELKERISMSDSWLVPTSSFFISENLAMAESDSKFLVDCTTIKKASNKDSCIKALFRFIPRTCEKSKITASSANNASFWSLEVVVGSMWSTT